MPLKKVKKAAKATKLGYQDYSALDKAIEAEAERLVGKSGSRTLDIQRQGRKIRQLKKERGVSLVNSIKSRYKSM
jgi:hypothetical protein